MKLRKVVLLLLAAALAAAGWPGHFERVQAGRGGPGSAEFGYGAAIDLEGPYLGDALALATDLPLDWLAIPLSWDRYPAPAGSTPAWQRLDRVMAFADHENLSVLVQVKSAPDAATGADGPLPDKTAEFVLSLASRYPAVQAVELFPHANTRAGWGRRPDPGVYLRVYRAVETALKTARLETVLVAGGLKPGTPTGQEMEDLGFLRELLSAARDDPLPVISLDLSEVRGDPLAAPESGPDVLRHYEPVRALMMKNGHQKSLLWITAFRSASGTIRSTGPNSSTILSDPTNRLFQAYTQLRSQLYIGAVFYQSLNPPATGSQNSALIQNEQEYHPFYRVLREFIAQNAPEAGKMQKGRPKDELFKKKSP